MLQQKAEAGCSFGLAGWKELPRSKIRWVLLGKARAEKSKLKRLNPERPLSFFLSLKFLFLSPPGRRTCDAGT
jgi:hypothetical protein